MTSKQMEAEVFARCTRAVRAAESGGVLDRVRAVADNRRLWEAVLMSVGDPANALPQDLRGGLARLAQAVVRECDSEEPDLAFIAEVNEHTAAGLWR